MVEAEDGTIKEVSLIIEKKSDDVSLKEVIGDDFFVVENDMIRHDSLKVAFSIFSYLLK